MEPITRWCGDIGMFAIDRPIPHSCVHATDYCRETCYNLKFYAMYPADMAARDERNEAAWQAIEPAALARHLDRKRHQTDRIRLMTRGEAFRDHSDIRRVARLAMGLAPRMLWIPTRAWRDMLLRVRIAYELAPIGNLTILASTDPSTTREEWESLIADGWSTMYYGTIDHPYPDLAFRCPKTFGHVKGACARCINGCFRPITKNRAVHVHLGAPH